MGDRWHAALTHPADARFVSLRAQAKDTRGNAVDQTIVRAYALGIVDVSGRLIPM
ncbi:hypothetical protein [Actinokineospora fastidiosa]|uniref:Uncharacterized protein n=1 Tax=Actinokineospora fastidiosa TaxID=1816 RepID=A0A918GL50_9PSEU|nr:hypothetical protein [Actinokineospora fastidiosa]GGS45729.1 hypothetical protein GCM10010171_46080 [Actinokineospora fastidiosa]